MKMRNPHFRGKEQFKVTYLSVGFESLFSLSLRHGKILSMVSIVEYEE